MASSAAPQSKKQPLIRDLSAGTRLDSHVFLVTQKDLRTTTNGSLYIHMVLADRTGQLPGRIWQATEAMYQTIPDGGFMRIRGRIEDYKNARQCIVDSICPVPQEEVDMSDFVPCTDYDIGEMWNELLAILRTVQNKHLLKLIEKLVKDEEVASRFRQSPAAVKMHHAYIGGLLEHTLSLLRLATRIFGEQGVEGSLYPKVSRDLILTAIFLHDIGKAWELTSDTAFKYTDEGQLIGHIVQGVILIDRKCREISDETGIPFPEEIRQAITHLVLSHHGTYEFGSPRLPATPEAIAIHHLDNLDAKINQFVSAINNDSDPASSWTDYIPSLQTRVYKRNVLEENKS